MCHRDDLRRQCWHRSADGAVYAAARQAVEVEPLNAAAQHTLGLAAEARGSLREAVTAFRMAVSLLPSNYGEKSTNYYSSYAFENSMHG